MNILIIGSSGREHAISDAISKSRYKPNIFSVMAKKNPGIARNSKDFLIENETNIEKILIYSKSNKIDLAIIGPEAPLAAGLSDALSEQGIGVVGPKKQVAQIEFDKAWTRNFMETHNIHGNPRFKIFFKDNNTLEKYIKELEFVAIKPAGLTGGKGVKVMGDQLPTIESAINYAKELVKNDAVVVEEKLEGEEFTLHGFVDGKSIVFMPIVQDHKRAFDGDIGPNTGGMGSYTDKNHSLPFITPHDVEDAKKIMNAVVESLFKESGIKYKGILYGGFMITKHGVKVIEFNSRFGDPEAMNLLPLLETDFVDVMKGIVNETLSKLDIKFSNKATVCKYAVPSGYPDSPDKDQAVIVGDTGDALLFYSSVYEKDNIIYTTTSRAIAVVGIADSIDEAEKTSQNALDNIEGNLHSRKDIGTSELIQKRITHMTQIRNECNKKVLKHLISMTDLSKKEINQLLDKASDLKKNRNKLEENALKNKSFSMIFEKSSTRTRVSFEVAVYELGGNSIYLNYRDIQIGRGESMSDTAKVLSRYVHSIIARVNSHEQIKNLSIHSTVPVINALSDKEHPCQVLADFLTIREYKNTLKGLKFAWIGDGNNVCNSEILGCAIVGMDIIVACPKGYEPDAEIIKQARALGGNVIITQDPIEAATNADVLYTDVWISMGDEEIKDKKIRDLQDYQINSKLLKLAKPDVIVMHCLPAHRGEEITAEVIDGVQSVVFDQAENRLHVQKALILKLMGKM